LEGNGNYSGGLGYRKALLNNQLVLGVNSFYDYNSRYGHARLGGGAEILSPVAEFRWNIYEPTSNARLVERQGTTQIFDTAAAGYDLELGAPVPYMPDFKLYGKHQKWDFKSGKDLVRDGFRGEWYLTSFARIDAESWYDSYVNGWAHRIGFVFRGDFDTTSRGFIFRGFNKEAYRKWNDKDVRWITTYRVVREFDIITERTARGAAGAVTINIGRGT
jgi:adhesin/invasin